VLHLIVSGTRVLYVLHLIVSGTTEKHKQRSSTEDNKNEHYDCLVVVVLKTMTRHVLGQYTGSWSLQSPILQFSSFVVVVDADKYNNSCDVTFVLTNDIMIETRKECSSL
jgi:hypothetical protein